MVATQTLALNIRGTARPSDPALVLMHFLGGSGREWDEVVALLGTGFKTITVDLPGFGGSASVPGFSVSEMADAVEAALAEHLHPDRDRYILVGHSMSGKVAAVLARRAQDRLARAAHGKQVGLAGLILIAPSPPGPEPMSEDKRSGMLDSLGENRLADPELDMARARSYISKNEQRDLTPAVLDRATREVLRMNRTAWVAWLLRGSKEDWARRVGVLDLPALIVTGDKDASLGPEFQLELTMPHLRHGELKTLKGCSHLIPMERPTELAMFMRDFIANLESQPKDLNTPQTSSEIAAPPAQVPDEYQQFLASERVSPKTREVLERRIAGPDAIPAAPPLNPQQTSTLHAVLARVLPQDSPKPQPQDGRKIDLAGFVLSRIASGKGDGWRYANLPEDAQSYREGLDRLAADGFDDMTAESQDATLAALAEKKDSAEARWFEEVRSDAATVYMAHPATLARLGYSGFGVGGADTRFKGFVTLGPDQREPWEPQQRKSPEPDPIVLDDRIRAAS